MDKILDFIPDPTQRAAAQAAALVEANSVARDVAVAQAAVNAAEASNSNLFVSGARPAIMWVCALVIAYTYIGAPILTVLVRAFVLPTFTPPSLDSGAIMALVTGMLGLSVSHTVENVQMAKVSRS